jgi:ATP-dependent DNA ligase
MIQLASGSGNAAALVFFLFDLLYVDGEDWTARPLVDRKTRLAASMRVCAKISLRPRRAARCRV